MQYRSALTTSLRRKGAAALVLAIAVLGPSPVAFAQEDRSAWLGRWAVDAQTCQNDGYDMLIEPDRFEIFEQACAVTSWSTNGNLLTLSMQCSNEDSASTHEHVQLLARGDIIERVGGYEFQPAIMARCQTPATASPTSFEYCSPINLGPKILSSPDINDIHPDWVPPNMVGTGWTLTDISRHGPFLSGTLNSSRGNPQPGTIYVLASEWECH